MEREKIGGVGQWTFFCLCLEENVLLRFLANGATTKRDASPRTTMMMERRDTQILSDLPPRCDVDDDDDDASIVVVVLSEEEDRHGRRSPPRTSTRSVPFFERRLQKGYDRSSLENHLVATTHRRGAVSFFLKGRPPSMIKQNSFLSSEKKSERETERSAPSPTRRRLSPPPTTTFFSFCCCCCS